METQTQTIYLYVINYLTLQLNKIAIDSVNLSWSQSPHQIFAPANRLHEISPYVSLDLNSFQNKKGIPGPITHEEGAFTGLGHHKSKLTQLEINSICSDNSNNQQHQYPPQFY